MSNTHDYLAVILIAGGSAWGRSPDKQAAIKNCLKVYKQDWGKLFKIRKGDVVSINVIDVHPHGDVTWDHQGWWAKVGDEYKLLDRKVEHVHATVH